MRFKTLVFAIFILLMTGFTQSTWAGQWRFPIAISYIGGINDVADLYDANITQESGVEVDSFGIPIGLNFHPYYEFDSG
ncbi:hypothetical protein, partial [Kaarinaea lacus]